MKPIAIFRHTKTEGPGYFATFLDQRSIPWQLIAIDQDEAVPECAEAFSGLCLMGGPMSVNDQLPWIGQVCALIRDANSRDIPVIGHCLGSQLMSKALGGVVTPSPIKEIGWGHAYTENNDSARPHLAMQCHVEMTSEMINEWCKSWATEVHGLDPRPVTVQTPEQMLSETPDRLPVMRLLADQLYSIWMMGLKRN